MTHSPTPWSIDEHYTTLIKSDEFQVAQASSIIEFNKRSGLQGIDDLNTVKANAELIVRAVNNHDALVEALERMITASEGSYYADNPDLQDEAEKAIEVLKLAKGE